MLYYWFCLFLLNCGESLAWLYVMALLFIFISCSLHKILSVVGTLQ
jgi:hypothetical protein